MSKSEYKRLMKHYANDKAERKSAIMNELLHGEKHDFYVNCVREGCAFDVTVGGTKYEIRPKSWHYLGEGAEAMFRGAESDYCYPTFDDDDILDILGFERDDGSMKIYLDKDGITNRKRIFMQCSDKVGRMREVYRVQFSGGSSCSCYFGAIEVDENKRRAKYGVRFLDDFSWMSKEAKDFVERWANSNTEVIEAPDFAKLNELGEAFIKKLFDSMTALRRM